MVTAGVELATDKQFQELSNFATPPKAGEITAVLGSGQVTVDTDDAEGGDVTAWPLNGFVYSVGTVVYVAFASNAPDSAVVLGAKDPVPGIDRVNLRDSDVDHGMTAELSSTDTYGELHILHATAGGLQIDAASDTDATALLIRGMMGSTNPTDSTPAIVVRGAKKNGTGIQALGADETVWALDNEATRLLKVLGDGDMVAASGAGLSIDIVRALGSSGLSLRDDGGNVGLTVLDAGQIVIVADDDMTDPYSGFGGQNNRLVVVRYATAHSASTPYTGFLFSNNQTDATSGLIAQLMFANEAIAASEKRLVQISAFTDDATNSGKLSIFIWNAGTLSEVVTILKDGRFGISRVSNPTYRLDVEGDPADEGSCQIRIGGTSATAGNALRVVRNKTSANTDSPVVEFIDDHAGDDQVLIRGQQDGSGDILNLFDGATEVMTLLDGGNFGLNVAAPQGRMHAYDGNSGFLFATLTAVTNATQTFIPDGTGDVTAGITGFFIIDNAGAVANTLTLLPSGTTDVVCGSGTWRFTVTAGGAFTVIRQSGTGSADITFVGIWQ